MSDPASVPGAEPTELVFAFSRAQGTVLDEIRPWFKEVLETAGFAVDEISMQRLLWHQVMGSKFDAQPNHEREIKAFELADQFRKEMALPDALARLAASEILDRREPLLKKAEQERRRGVAWVLSHVDHPDDVHFLRRQFGPGFFLIAVFEDSEPRRDTLVKRYRKGQHGLSKSEAESAAKQLLDVDAGLRPSSEHIDGPEFARFRSDLAKTFPLADVFVAVSDDPDPTEHNGKSAVRLEHRLERRGQAKLAQLVAQIVGYPFATPDPHELGMAYAYLARVASASLGRQVGAAIVSSDGDLIAVGWNEVPAPRVGVYRQHFSNLPFLLDLGLEDVNTKERDFRDHMLTGTSGTPQAGDSNSRIRYDILVDLLHRLNELGVLDAEGFRVLAEESNVDTPRTADGLDHARVWAALLLAQSTVKKATFSAMLEYGRSVHAEMNAITTAARTGASIRHATLYTTTFPCHECARHIIASGMGRVIYIEPFQKSRVFELHGDAVVSRHATPITEDAESHELVQFLPFIGISPWRHEELFSMVHRKKVDQQESDPGAVLAMPDDLWGVAEWSLETGRLRPAFRPHQNPELLQDRLREAIDKVKEEQEKGDSGPAS